MFHASNPFAQLASKVERGDAAARVQLRQQMERELVHIVRRTLSDGRGTTSLERRILAEARRVRREVGLDAAEHREQLVRLVAQRLCATVITNLRSTPARERTTADTVC